MASPFELYLPYARLLHGLKSSRRTRIVATVYDLIPLLMADRYLRDPQRRWAYRARVELIRAADHLLAISGSTAADLVEHLGISPERITVVGTGVSPRFVSATDRDDAFREASESIPGLRPAFIMYTGGIDYRKNIDGLLEGYSRLPETLRREHQLVIVCRVDEQQRVAMGHRMQALGISRDVLLTGFVPDATLRSLYQSCELFVFPSLYEGFGLPVAEAQACGAVAIASDNSSLVELVPEPRGRFDPRDVDAICAALGRGLLDAELRSTLRACHKRREWSDVADSTAEVYNGVLSRPSRAARRRIAIVSPFPPLPTGVADYSARLARALDREVDVVRFDPTLSAHSESAYAADHLETISDAMGGFDGMLVKLGNSEHHVGSLNVIKQHPECVVLAHDVRLENLVRSCGSDHTALPMDLHAQLAERDAGLLPQEHRSYRSFPLDEYQRFNRLFAGPAAMSRRTLVHSPFARQMMLLDNPGLEPDRVVVVPFGFPEVSDDANAPTDPGAGVVVSMGVTSSVKQTPKVVAAFAEAARLRPLARFAIVGAVPERDRAGYLTTLRAAGVSDRVFLTGWVDEAGYRSWLGAAAVAVQLRDVANGESSASVADCLAHGLAVICTEGLMPRAPQPAPWLCVPRDVTVSDLAQRIIDLLDRPDRRAEYGELARSYVKQNSIDAAADAILRAMSPDGDPMTRPDVGASPAYPGSIRHGAGAATQRGASGQSNP